MATHLLPGWANRNSTQTRGENIICITKDIAAASLGTIAAADFIPIITIPFGSRILKYDFYVRTATAATAAGTTGICGSSALADGVLTPSNSTGYDADGIIATSHDLNSAGVKAGDGVLIGRKLDATIFSASADFEQPLIIYIDPSTASVTYAALVGQVVCLIQVP